MEIVKDEISWEEIMGKDLKMRRVVNGTGDIAGMGMTITCNMKGYLLNGDETDSNHFEEWKNQKFKIGESDAIPGVEMALRFSRVGDVLRVRCQSRFAYGPTGRPPVAVGGNADQPDSGEPGRTIPAIPADSDLEYELEVTAHLPEGQIDPNLLASAIRAQKASVSENVGELPVKVLERLLALTELQQRKEAGNRWFSYSDFARAARAYSKATQVADRFFNGNANASNTNAKALEGLNMKDGAGDGASVAAAEAALAAAEKEKEQQRRLFEAGDEQVVSVYVSCLNNMAACQLRLGDYAKAKDICVRVLEMDPGNHKALLRAAKAALATHSFEECELCLQSLLAVAPAGSSAALAATAERRRLKQAQQDYKQQRKQMSSNMAKQLFRAPATSNGATKSRTDADSSGSSSSNNGEHSDTNGKSATTSSVESGASRDSSGSSTGTAHSAVDRSGDTASASAAGTVTDSVTDAAKAPPAAVAPAVATATKAPAAAADTGLLLLLVTSLLVLLVSVVMVVWTSGKRGGEAGGEGDAGPP